MHPTPIAPAVALLLAGATALPAQPRAPRAPAADSVVRETTRGDTVIREVIVRRPRAGDAPDGFDRLDGPAVFFDGPARVAVAPARAATRRSAIGVYLGRADADGLRVERVAPDGPAARAGIAAGDRLVAVEGTSLRVDRADADDPLLAAVPARRLERAVGRLAPGSEVELRVARDGRERAVRARTVAPNDVGERTPTVRTFRRGPDGFSWTVPDVDGRLDRLRERLDDRFRDAPFRDDRFRDGRPDADVTELRRRARARADSARARADARPVLGVTLESSRSSRDTLGLFVAAVAAGGPAERAGLVEGDRIAGINGVDLRVPREERDDRRAADARRARFTRELERLRPGDRATLRVWGDGRWRTVAATVGRAADVYRQPQRFGLDAGDDLLPIGPARVELLRGLRAAPMPNLIGPEFGPAVRGFVGPDVRIAPLPPLPPMAPGAPVPPPARPGRRLVRI